MASEVTVADLFLRTWPLLDEKSHKDFLPPARITVSTIGTVHLTSSCADQSDRSAHVGAFTSMRHPTTECSRFQRPSAAGVDAA